MQLTNDTISLSFSDKTGALRHLSFLEGESVLGHRASGQSLDACLGAAGWLSQRKAPWLISHSESDAGITLEVAFGSIVLHDEYQLEGSLITRKVRVENRSANEIQLLGLRLCLIGAQIGAAGDCTFEAPASVIRPRLSFETVTKLEQKQSPNEMFKPGSVGWMGFLGGSPDVTPGLLAIHNPERDVSLLLWYYSEIESAMPMVASDGHSLNLGHDLGLASWIAPGSSIMGGTQFIQLVNGTWGEALEAYSRTYQRVGLEPTIYEAAPDWVPEASIYEVHPGQFGGFRGMTDELPRIGSMGFNVLYLMPVMQFDNRSAAVWDENWLGSGSPYAMKDFEKFEESLGTRDDFIHLVDEAHRLGMKVLMDFVAQGSALDARYLKEHPEWYCRDEKDDLVSSHGWVDTYSLDWANPDYQAYMLSWALRFVQEFNIDGYRVDAPLGKEPNWDRRIPYHASYTNLGSLRMLEELQRGVKAINPDAALLCESFGPVFVKSHDFQYDYHLHGMLYALLDKKISPYEFGEWLRDYWIVMPPSAKRVCFTETHDTRVDFPAYAWRGSMAERAMFAILILAGFIPMVWAGQEVNLEDFYRRLLTARANSQALLHGERRFNLIHCNNPQVLSILCNHDNELVWGVVSLYAERTPLTFDISSSGKLEPSSDFQLHDLLQGMDWNEYGKDKWGADEARELTLSLVPFEPYFFRIVQVA